MRGLAGWLLAGFVVLGGVHTARAQAPTNDVCSGATVIPFAPYSNSQSNTVATSVGDPTPSCLAGFTNGVWYRYTATSNQIFSVTTAGSDFDTGLAVYTGTCGALTEVTCSHNFIRGSYTPVSVLAASNTTYFILVGGANNATGKLGLGLSASPAPPANDQCSGAIVIATNNYTNALDTTYATSTGDPTDCIGRALMGVWYRYTAPSIGLLEVDTMGSDFDTMVGLYSGSCGALTWLGCDDNGGGGTVSRLTYLTTSNTTYYFLAGGFNGARGNLKFHFSFNQPETNDACSGAIAISSFNYTNVQSTTNASVTGDPVPNCAYGFTSAVWYKFTAPAAGQILVDAIGTSYIADIAIYSGTCGALTPVNCTSFGSALTISATSNTTYYVLVSGYNEAYGTLVFHLKFAPPPANDECSGAIVISSTSYTNFQYTLGATSTNDPFPTCASYSSQQAIWYKFTVPVAGQLVVDASGSDFYAGIALFTGTCGSLTQIACNNNTSVAGGSKISIPATANTTYYILAGGFFPTYGNLVFHLNLYPPPASDLCGGATVISGSSYTNIQPTYGASSAGDPAPSCISVPTNGVWYQFTAPASGFWVVETLGSDFNTGLAIYTGACGSLTQIACDDNGGASLDSKISLSVTSSVTYYVLAVGSHVGGTLVLHSTFYPVPANDQCSGAIVISSRSYTNEQVTYAATSTGDPIPNCLNTPGKGVWYQYTSPAVGHMIVDAIGSDFSCGLGIYTGTCGSLTQVGCNQNSGGNFTGMISMSTLSNKTYYILAAGAAGATGNLKFHLNVLPQITSLKREGSNTRVTWNGMGGYFYVVQVSTNLSASNSFRDLSGPVYTSGSGVATANYLDVGAVTNGPKKYYRVRGY